MLGQQFTEIVAVEHEMRAPQHHRINAVQVISVKVVVQRAHHQIMIAKLTGLHNLHQIRAGFLENRVIGVETLHKLGEFPLTQGQGSSCHNHPLWNMLLAERGVPAVASHFQCRLHADDRNVIMLAQIVHRGGGSGIAGNDHGLDTVFNESFHDVKT